MNKVSHFRVLIYGVISPVAAIAFYTIVYGTLTQISPNVEKDWWARLALAGLAMTAPFFATLAMAIREGRRQPLARASKAGLGIAVLSLGLVLKPISDGTLRAKQNRNQAMRDVIAPAFDTTDIFGNRQRLADHRGEVVLVNIWASWCEPCRSEMPKLDQLYHERKDKGLIVFGFSAEDTDVQRKFLQQIPVSYPLLTLDGQVPSFYRDVARYPAIFLIDRKGRLQPAPGPGQPFESVTAAVDALIGGGAK